MTNESAARERIDDTVPMPTLSGADRHLVVDAPEGLALGGTLGGWQTGRRDPSVRVTPDRVDLCWRTPDGPVAVRLTQVGARVDIRAWGPGAGGLDATWPGLLGVDDNPAAHRPDHPVLAPLARRFSGLRYPRGRPVLDAALPAILGQRVTTAEAVAAHRRIVVRYGVAAPGPLDLVLPLAPEVARRIPYHELHTIGVDRRRAQLVAAVAAVSDRLEQVSHDSQELQRRLRTISGIGPWTAAIVAQTVCGDADAAIVGDLHLPGLVVWSLAGERDGDDRRMLALLEPFLGHRARVQRHLLLSGRHPPARHARARIIDHRRR